jgi:hypothetical protein
MSVQAELLAVSALRAYLLRTLPAKVATINSERAAVLKAPWAGSYTIPSGASLKVGIVPGSETTVALTAGTRTAAQVATDLTAGAVSGLTFSADTQGRLTTTASQAPVSGTHSIVSIGADSTGANAALGFDPGGELKAVCAIAAPTNQGITDGQPELIDLRSGFWLILGERRAVPRSNNIRDDMHLVTVRAELLASEPNESTSASHEYIGACVRAVRECILDDRTLDNQVHLAEPVLSQYEARTFRFASGGVSPLMSAATIDFRLKVYERT